MKKQAWLIFNPAAGKADSQGELQLIEQELGEAFDLIVRLTSPDEGAEHYARAALEARAEVVIASGGDGTVSAVADVIAGTGVHLGIIPRGTANSVALALGLPQATLEACQVIRDGHVRCIDTARCNGQAMILLAGMGFGAQTIAQASRDSKNKFGILAYVLSGLQQLKEMSNFDVRIETEDKVVSCKAVAVTVANMAPATSVMAQGPATVDPDDGELDITIIAATGMLEAVSTGYHLLWNAIREQPVERDNIGFLRAKTVRVTADPPQAVLIDGEETEFTQMTVECLPGNLHILVQQQAPVEQLPEEKLEGLPELQIEAKS